MPQLRVFDFKRITTKEREEARKLFGGKAGKKLLDEMKNTFTPGEELERNIKARLIFYLRENEVYLYDIYRKGTGMSEEEKKRIKEAILAAKSLEEVEILQQQLQMGKFF